MDNMEYAKRCLPILLAHIKVPLHGNVCSPLFEWILVNIPCLFFVREHVQEGVDQLRSGLVLVKRQNRDRPLSMSYLLWLLVKVPVLLLFSFSSGSDEQDI